MQLALNAAAAMIVKMATIVQPFSRAISLRRPQQHLHRVTLYDYFLLQIANGQIVRSRYDKVRPSAEVVDQFLDECLHKPVTTPTTTSSKLFALVQDTFHHPVPTAVVCGEPRLPADDMNERLLVDLDEQMALCRRQSAAVIEQVFDAMDFTQDTRARGLAVSTSSNFTSLVSVQCYNSQGIG